MTYRKGGAGKRRDTIEPEIIKALRAHGWTVQQCGGRGLPDLLCIKAGFITMNLEVKSGINAKLTKAQRANGSVWPLVHDVDEALHLAQCYQDDALKVKS
jgi:Holliday junction resolvase